MMPRRFQTPLFHVAPDSDCGTSGKGLAYDGPWAATHLKYRPDIDGMRALAVLAVMVFHAFPRLLPGGFIGVDIFFVISGYLISGILYKGLREGSFHFSDFYARRIRRIFPALITVVLLCLVYGRLILLPGEYEQMGRHVAAGIVFAQNIVFWQESGYFDISALLKPLLHLWSLAVEEQFYIVFPPLLLLFWKKKWPMAVLIWAMLGASFAANVAMSYQNRGEVFFLTPFRAWEFLAGSLLAWWHFGKRHEDGAPHSGLLSTGGALLLAAGIILIDMRDPFPGWRAMLPVAGSVMLIAAGSQAWVNKKILSSPPLVWIGLISYPLYLFHWPALSFVRIVMGNRTDTIHLAAALGTAFCLSVATYYLIERPVRFAKSQWTVPVLIAAFILVGAVGGVVGRGGLGRALSPEIGAILAAQNDRYPFDELESTRFTTHRTGGDGKQTLFIGDSHMSQYWPRIQNLLKANKLSDRGAIFITCPGVPPIQSVKSDFYDGEQMMSAVSKVLEEDKRIDRVVMAARWGLYFKPNSGYFIGGDCIGSDVAKPLAYSRLGEMVHDLTGKGIRVTLVLSTPTGEKLAPQNMVRRNFYGKIEKRIEPQSQEEWKSTARLFDGLADAALSQGARVINPVAYLCADGVCISESGGVPIRYDKSHLRPGYVREHLLYLDETVAP